ncbi:MAG TPA: folylpolyglutamate synthase/dihydrofolate synthase family protein [Vicinamibacterales bacterium]|nr:folylpolyglutamate synthase/dihydrofolate synthase family protein [Vicinamibacterales bacterium]
MPSRPRTRTRLTRPRRRPRRSRPIVRAYLESLEPFGTRLGLSTIRALVTALDRPDRAYASVLVAGTNGKGSVTAIVERALRAAGCRTGRYTSPHLSAIEERFEVSGAEVAPAVLDAALERVRAAAAGLASPPTFFEVTTAAALEIFRTAQVDVAVIEVGLGGRLDATNVVEPIAGAITAIDFDHMAELGHRLEDIAREKAGIVRPGIPIVLGRNRPAARDAVAAACEAAGAHLVDADASTEVESRLVDGRTILRLRTPHAHHENVQLALRGRHQIDNAVTAVRLLEEWPALAGGIGEAAIRVGLEQTVWPARLELLHWQGQPVLLDAAHNPAGARALVSYLGDAFGRRLPLVVGIMRDKAIDEMLRVLAPAASRFVLTAADTPRAASATELSEQARRVCPDVPQVVAANPVDALARAASAGSPVVVAGSLYLVGEIRPWLS